MKDLIYARTGGMMMRERRIYAMRNRFIYVTALLLTLALLPLSGLALSLTPQGDIPEAGSGIEGITLSWKEPAAPSPDSVFTAEWTEDGEQYEMCIVGLPRALTEEEVLLLITARRAGIAVDLEDPALTDAEKFTNKLSSFCGDWLVDRGDWGDSRKCWAAASANMLWLTGWAGRAVDPDTGAPFTSEDEVFDYISARVMNDGSWHPACVKWFFTGQDADGLMPLLYWEEEYPALLPSFDPGAYLNTSLILPPEFSEQVSPADLAGMLPALSLGAAGGINVGAGSAMYSLLPGAPAGPEDEVISFDDVTGKYVITLFGFGLEPDSPELEKTLYTYNPDGTVRKVVKTESGYADESGAPVDALWVLDGYIHTDPESGLSAPAIKEENFDEYSWTLSVPVSEEWVDTQNPRHLYTAGHGHALTLTGYIINRDLGEAQALFIADSDNDAEYFVIDDTVSPKEDRPNSYRFCPLAYHPYLEDGLCIELVGYLPGRDTVLSDVTVLYPPEAAAEK
ncbi:MAG: hypothetical protein CW338_10110 [Clostridiales bacterium]|nr:hypothetical protein [Clostridiales bacterium]